MDVTTRTPRLLSSVRASLAATPTEADLPRVAGAAAILAAVTAALSAFAQEGGLRAYLPILALIVLVALGVFVWGVPTALDLEEQGPSVVALGLGALALLTVPVVFPIAMALKIDPVHLAIMITLNVEMGVVTPPVGLNLFAVSGTARIPIVEVVKGTIPFFLGDLSVLLLVVFFPGLATWLPNLLVTDVFR